MNVHVNGTVLSEHRLGVLLLVVDRDIDTNLLQQLALLFRASGADDLDVRVDHLGVLAHETDKSR